MKCDEISKNAIRNKILSPNCVFHAPCSIDDTLCHNRPEKAECIQIYFNIDFNTTK